MSGKLAPDNAVAVAAAAAAAAAAAVTHVMPYAGPCQLASPISACNKLRKGKTERRLSWRRRRQNIRLGKENVLVSKVGLEGPEPFLDVSIPNLT